MIPVPAATVLGATPLPLSHDERARVTAQLVDQAHDPDTSPGRRAFLLQQVVVVNHRVACAVARRYAQRGIDDDDLQQAACEGLVKAVQRFDPGLGHDLLTFAVPSIRGEVRRHFRDHGWMVRPPRRLQQLQWALTHARDELALALGREPTRAELRARLDVDETALREVEASFGCFRPPSLDLPVAGGSSNLGDLLAAPPGTDEMEARVVLHPLLRRLSPRDRELVRLRFVEDLTQQEIGEALGVTQAQVSRMLTRVLGSLREELTAADDGPRTALATPA